MSWSILQKRLADVLCKILEGYKLMDKYTELSLMLEANSYEDNTDPTWIRWTRGGLAAVLRPVNAQSYGEMVGKKGPWKKTYATSVGIPIGVFLYKMYKMNKQRCKHMCNDQSCLKGCYSRAIDGVINRINQDMAAVTSVKDRAVRTRLQVKLQNQMRLYVRKKQNLTNES